MNKVIIIGANSFIARNLIYVFKTSYPNTIIKLYGRENIHGDDTQDYTKIDVLNPNSVRLIDFNCDVIFMMVGRTGVADSLVNASLSVDVNEKALLNILNEYRNQNSKAKIVFPSTRLIYSGRNGHLCEDDAIRLNSVYAVNKFACEQYLRIYHDIYDVQYCIFRICVIYGSLIGSLPPYGTINFMLSKAKNHENILIYGDGSQRRTFSHIGDVCKAMIEGAISKKCKNDIFNIGGENYSINEIAELVARRYNVSVEHVTWPNESYKYETGDTVFDDSKLVSIIGDQMNSQFKIWCEQLS